MAASARKEKLAERGDNLRNIVREYHELLKQEFGDERRRSVKEEFATFAADPAIEIIDDIASMEGVPRAEKIQALQLIFDANAKALEQLLMPQLSSLKWENRPREQLHIDPCQFVIDNYPSYGDGLILPDIRQHDFKLYRALDTRKQKDGWPATFNLPTKREYLEKLVAETSEVDLTGLNDLPPPIRRQKKQLYSAKKRRATQLPTTKNGHK